MDEFPKIWEEISNDTAAHIHSWRLRVPGGWLVLVLDTTNSFSTTVLVPNPDHRWTLTTS